MSNQKNRFTPDSLDVKSAFNLTPNMRRITLEGESIAQFPTDSEGNVIKLLFNIPSYERPAKRTYTISRFRPSDQEIDIDFMLHKSTEGSAEGIAVPWALNTQPGDSIEFFGPGPGRFVGPDAIRFLLAADMTSLPALAANLKRLPKHAVGKTFIEIIHDEDKQQLTSPENIDIQWITNSSPGSDSSPLYHAIKQSDFSIDELSVWVACEYKTMKKIRHYLKVERGIQKTNCHISSYWKKGNTEEQHKSLNDIDERN